MGSLSLQEKEKWKVGKAEVRVGLRSRCQQVAGERCQEKGGDGIQRERWDKWWKGGAKCFLVMTTHIALYCAEGMCCEKLVNSC
jgi:hypothetical protein